MKKKSSNIEMETVFKILNEIQRVEAPKHLEDKILNRISLQQKTIPLSWVKVAAAILLFTISAEAYTISHKLMNENENNNISEQLVSTTNNSLYYE